MASDPAAAAPDARCTWCGVELEREHGLRLRGPGDRAAAFCRLEHVVPWVLRGARWETAEATESGGPAAGPDRCSECGAALADASLLLVQHRAEHRIRDGFCSPEHLRAWAAKGGRWG